jgi:hypothetical protein
MAAIFGVVVSKGSKMIRHIIDLNLGPTQGKDSDLTDGTHRVGPGEEMHIFSVGPNDLATVTALIAQKTGITPANSRCAVVDSTNTVVSCICADAIIDSVAGHTLINHPTVAPGDIWNASTRLFTRPAKTGPAVKGSAITPASTLPPAGTVVGTTTS